MSGPTTTTETNPLRQALPRTRVPEPCAVVLFGATGDLAHRKLVPALFQLAQGGNLPSECAIVGFARRDWTDDDLRAEYEKTLAKERRRRLPARSGAQFASRICLRAGDVRRPGSLPEAQGDARASSTGRTARGATGVYYLAVSPEFFATIISHLGEAGLIYPWQQDEPLEPGGHREAVRPRPRERPALNREVSHVLDESQVYRIDHYLGKETVQNILALRFGNTIFEPIWDRRYVALGADHGGRGGRDGRRPGGVLRHRRHAPRHGPEPHDAVALPGGDGAAGGPLGRRGAQREGQGACRRCRTGRRRTCTATSSAPSTRPARSRGRRSPATSRRRGSRPTRRRIPTSRSGWS